MALANIIPKFSRVYRHHIHSLRLLIPEIWVNPTPRHIAQAAVMVDPAGDGVQLLHVTIAMLTLSWITLCARLAVRKWLKPEAMGADDYLMFVGLVRSHLPVPLLQACPMEGR